MSILKTKIKSALKRMSRGTDHLATEGLFGYDAFADIAHFLRDRHQPVLFDVGANVGQTTLELAKRLPAGKIYSFEPVDECFQKLCRATASLPNVQCELCALSDENGTAKVHVTCEREGSSLLSLTGDTLGRWRWTSPDFATDVPVLRLDRFCADHSIDHIDLLKLDVQGAERKVLDGAGDMLQPAKVEFVFAEVLFRQYYEGQAYFHQVYERLQTRGYRLVGLYKLCRNENHRLDFCDALFAG
jgi:FkbM family methyltransferase